MTCEREEEQDLRAAALLCRLPDHAPGAAIRVRARIVQTSTLPPRTPWWLLLGSGVGGGVLVSAIAMLVLLEKDGVTGPARLASTAPIAGTLVSPGVWATDNSLAGVALSFDGTGEIGGTAGQPRIRWEVGTLHVEVTPDRGTLLEVETRDAEVRVVGTSFSVSRDALGTRVEVRHGKVEVDCRDELPVSLGAGDTWVCLPRSAGGLIGRARALEQSGASSAVVLEAVEHGLALASEPGAIRDELVALRVSTLVDLGRHSEALVSARSYLANPNGVRRVDVERLALTAANARGGCAVAAPWLLDAGPTASAGCAAR